MGSFQKYLASSNLSENTIKGYTQSVNGYLKWFAESKGVSFTNLHRENMREYKSYLKTIETVGPKTINTKLSGLVKINEFLIHSKKQSNLVFEKSDFVKVQQQYASLAKVEFQDAEIDGFSSTESEVFIGVVVESTPLTCPLLIFSFGLGA